MSHKKDHNIRRWKILESRMRCVTSWRYQRYYENMLQMLKIAWQMGYDACAADYSSVLISGNKNSSFKTISQETSDFLSTSFKDMGQMLAKLEAKRQSYEKDSELNPLVRSLMDKTMQSVKSEIDSYNNALNYKH